MDKYSELAPKVPTEHRSILENRWGHLHGLEKERADQAIKYLFLTNSGGAIATLSFLGASKGGLDYSSIAIALGFFAGGVVLVGISNFSFLGVKKDVIC